MRNVALGSSIPLDRLRKEAAGQRLLARMAAYLPEGSWALKGGLALIVRLQTHVRATKDIDATWRMDASNFHEVLRLAASNDMDDFFEFTVAPPSEIQTEGPEGGLRFQVMTFLDGREFEQLQLDVNLVPNDSRPIEQIMGRNVFGFAGIDAPLLPTISVMQHLAEKLHAYCRDYGANVNSRAKDLHDMLLIADQLELPSANELVAQCRETFALRNEPWPPTLSEPPSSWKAAWAGYVRDYGLRWTSIDEAFNALGAFWQPLFDVNTDTWKWSARKWEWECVESLRK